MDTLLLNINLFVNSSDVTFSEIIRRALSTIWDNVWPYLLKLGFVCLPLYTILASVKGHTASDFLLALISLVWMHLFPLLMQPLRGGSLSNCFSCLVQTFWITTISTLFLLDTSHRNLISIFHTLSTVAIVFLPTDTSDSFYYSREHWPSWILSTLSFLLVLCLWWIPLHTIPVFLTLGVLAWIVILGFFIHHKQLTVPDSFAVPTTMQWFGAMLILDGFFCFVKYPVLATKILCWLNVIYLLFETNRKMFHYKDALQCLRSIVPQVLSKIGIALPKIVQMMQHGFAIAKWVIIVNYVLTVASGIGFFRVFVQENAIWGCLIVLLNVLQNLIWIFEKLCETLFYSETEIQQIQKKSFADMKPEEKVGVILAGRTKSKKGLKAKDMRIIYKATKQIDKQAKN